MRIVSLLPSASDIVVALGAGEELVGVSHSCGRRELPSLTSTWVDTTASNVEIDAQVRGATRPLYELDVTTLADLAPDVVISQSLCDVCAVPSGDVYAAIDSLPTRPVLVDLTPNYLADVPRCFDQVGKAIQRQDEAIRLKVEWHTHFASYHNRFADHGLRIAFLDWLDPPFIAGHWIPDMLSWMGVTPVLGESGKPSYVIEWQQLTEQNPDLILAACCGVERERAMQEERERAMQEAPNIPMVCLDGSELFSRPSPALMPSLECMANAIEDHLGRV